VCEESNRKTDQHFVIRVLLQRIPDELGGLVQMGSDLLPEVIGEPDVEFLDVVHLIGETGVEVEDGDDVSDAEGECDGRVLGGVEIAEVESGDYLVRLAERGFGLGE
jgi:hypothetical protein